MSVWRILSNVVGKRGIYMKKLKHVAYISVALILTIVIIYLFFPQSYIKMVTEDVGKIERAIVTVNDKTTDKPLCVIEIKEETELVELYGKIKETEDIKVNRYPRHSVVESASREYEIQLIYGNGKVDRFGTPENPQFVYRMLENEDNGYIIGQNNELLEYVLELANKNK